MTAKEQIIDLFRKNVKGKRPNVEGRNERHDGRKGHWLEQQFGITANADNEADLLGYELKNETTSKTTFGDWSANMYVFTNPRYSSLFQGTTKHEKQDSFVKIFGKPNAAKGGRCSWSGSPCPKIGSYNDFGQILVITPDKDIVALYSYSRDRRVNKAAIIPQPLQIENLEIARWYGEHSPTSKRTDKCLKAKLEDKFNDKGWFTCKTNYAGVYTRICFGKPMNYDEWLRLVSEGTVFFDSGMYEGNMRPYSQWRANNNFWDSLIIEEYK
ncbi:MAG: LlaMI family restriction endonuclease [[Eubacterium] sulci]|jgi:type-2 restriction enzyme scrFI|nr:LlaMI family restriction endonuclease [[Eubacterium] sulci]DAX83477.1 MAG TPA: LlaMI restriction endonuclease [Caudoviricetes sp.]